MTPEEIAAAQRAFLERQFGDQVGYLWLANADWNHDANKALFFKQYAFQYPEELDIAVSKIQQWDSYGKNIWWSVNLTETAANRKARNTKYGSVVQVDLDGGILPSELKLVPNDVLETSPGHFHAIYQVDGLNTAYATSAASRRIAYFHKGDDKDGADLSGWDQTQLLRVPYTRNHKYPEKPLIPIVQSQPAKYRLEDFDVYPTPQKSAKGDPGSIELPPFDAPLPTLPQWFQDFVADEVARGKDRSGAGFRCVIRLMELGYPWGLIRTMLRFVTPYMEKAQEMGDDWLADDESRLLVEGVREHQHQAQNCWKAECPNVPKNPITNKPIPEPPYTYEMEVLRIAEAEQVIVSIKTPDDHEIPVPPTPFLIKGIWPHMTHGPIAGGKKTFKSYNALAMSIAIGSGEPYLGQFEVANPGPVFYMIGEGGYGLWQRRHNRMCGMYGIRPKDSNVYALDTTFPIDSPEFAALITKVNKSIDPVAIVLDPMYAFHASGIEAQNLYDRGKMLAQLSKLVGHDRSLLVPDHMRKPPSSVKGKDVTALLDLDEISQAGMAQWAGSWVLHAHREPYDRENGIAYLAVEFGSRVGLSRQWALDLTVGPFDDDLGDHTGDISFEIFPLDASAKPRNNGSALYPKSTMHTMLIQRFGTSPTEKPEILEWLEEGLGVGRTQKYDRFNGLVNNGFLEEVGKKIYKVAHNAPKTEG